MVRGLLRACHPLPAVMVTACITTLAWRLGWGLDHCALLLAAVFTGQVSVGWSNDAHDAQADTAAQRMTKPVVSGSVTVRQLWFAAFAAAGCCVPLTVLAAGVVAGMFHLAAVAMAWVYNLRLSRTGWSWLPYVVAFGCLPFLLCLGAPGHALPPIWFVIATASLGVGAHLANAGADLDVDRAGAAVMLGHRGTLAVALVMICLAVAMVLLPVGAVSVVLAVTGGLIAVGLVLAAGIAGWRHLWKASFRTIMLLAAWCVLLLVAAAP